MDGRLDDVSNFGSNFGIAVVSPAAVSVPEVLDAGGTALSGAVNADAMTGSIEPEFDGEPAVISNEPGCGSDGWATDGTTGASS